MNSTKRGEIGRETRILGQLSEFEWCYLLKNSIDYRKRIWWGKRCCSSATKLYFHEAAVSFINFVETNVWMQRGYLCVLVCTSVFLYTNVHICVSNRVKLFVDLRLQERH